MNDTQKLKERKSLLETIIKDYDEQISNEKLTANYERRNQLEEKRYKIIKEYLKIDCLLEIMNTNPIISSNEVDLYKNNDLPEGRYIVCIHGTKKIIGEVGCNSENNNIFYAINKKYQNKGYGFQAVVSLLNYLILCGIENIVIVIEKENKPSIRLADKLKKIFPDYTFSDNKKLVFYRFKISSKHQEKNTNKLHKR